MMNVETITKVTKTTTQEHILNFTYDDLCNIIASHFNLTSCDFYPDYAYHGGCPYCDFKLTTTDNANIITIKYDEFQQIIYNYVLVYKNLPELSMFDFGKFSSANSIRSSFIRINHLNVDTISASVKIFIPINTCVVDCSYETKELNLHGN